eukprot:Awhi_evm1s15694
MGITHRNGTTFSSAQLPALTSGINKNKGKESSVNSSNELTALDLNFFGKTRDQLSVREGKSRSIEVLPHSDISFNRKDNGYSDNLNLPKSKVHRSSSAFLQSSSMTKSYTESPSNSNNYTSNSNSDDSKTEMLTNGCDV